MLKKLPSNKINGTQNGLVFLLQAPSHRNFTFNIKHKVGLSKTVCGIFDSVSFVLKFIFLFNKMHVLFNFKKS